MKLSIERELARQADEFWLKHGKAPGYAYVNPADKIAIGRELSMSYHRGYYDTDRQLLLRELRVHPIENPIETDVSLPRGTFLLLLGKVRSAPMDVNHPGGTGMHRDGDASSWCVMCQEIRPQVQPESAPGVSSIRLYGLYLGGARRADVVELTSGKVVVSWPTSVIVYDSMRAAKAVHVEHMAGRGEPAEFRPEELA